VARILHKRAGNVWFYVILAVSDHDRCKFHDGQGVQIVTRQVRTMSKKSGADSIFSLFSLARSKFEHGKEEAGKQYLQSLLEVSSTMARDDFSSAHLADPELLQRLYLSGAHDALLNLFEAGDISGDNAAIMAASIYFSRNEPHKALLAAKGIGDFEQRRLRQKTVELWQDIHAPLEHEPRVHLLVLAHNREDYAEESLRQLGRTDYRNYAVFLADNGSSDSTWEIVCRAKEFFPPHVPVHIQRFPTNIGRPAGHNWLLTGHDHSAADYIAIGDDDLISVPPTWLTAMVNTIRAFPNCACVGGKAKSPGWPAMIHAGIRNITDFGPGYINLTNNGESPDLGQFDYVDIVDHVIGCLHIFDRKHLEQAGLFDIRFSPCQCVDIEHHLRMRLAGMNIVFNGLISFVHLRGMGKAVGKEKALQGNSLGNLMKLSYKYEAETVHREIAERHAERNRWLVG